MRNATLIFAAALLAAPLPALASGPAASSPLTGDYVEARTAEVFAGGCIMSSEGEPSGREAILAWHVDQGAVNGVSLAGLSIVAVVAADRNLGTQELGGAAPRVIKTALRIDDRANAEQREALVAMARRLAPGLVADVVDVKAVPIAFTRDASHVMVHAGEARLDVMTHMKHDPSCGALQWFQPLAKVTGAEMGLTRTEAWSGSSLGSQWQMSDRRSSFFGTFSIGAR
ncbi:MAG TPA: DUF1326 domain-containing protein [Vicinamibacterales bacterium]|nr:DUF1326 domain-containing protein [Vicinamibacterales bacterium]